MLSNLDKNRLIFLFRIGVGKDQIRKFLDERKSPLTLQGASYRRRKDTPQGNVDFLLSLPDKALPVVKKWFLEHIEADDALLPEALVAQFQAMEREEDSRNPESLKSYAQQGLKYLLQDDPPGVWLAFLRTRIGEEAEREDALATEAEATEPDTAEAQQTPILGIIRSVNQDDCDVARSYLEQVKSPELRTELDQLLIRHRGRSRLSETSPRQLRTLTSVAGVDPERVAVLLHRSRHTEPDQPIFPAIRGMAMEGALYSLSAKQAHELFENDCVIAFPNQKGARIPQDGELGVWFVERFLTEKPIKFRLRKPAEALYVVVPLAAAYEDFDMVRNAIRNATLDPWIRPVFRLSKGGYLHLPPEIQSRSRLNEPLQYFSDLPVWDVHGMRVVLGPLPQPDGEYDCADLSVVTARILRESDARRQLPALTAAQVGLFIDALRATDAGLTKSRLDRIALDFEHYVASGGNLEQIVEQVLTSKPIAAVIEAAKRTAVEQELVARKDLQEQRKRLEKECKDLKDRRDGAADDARKMAEQVRMAVRRAFERARASGVKSLADVAVFGALLTPGPAKESVTPASGAPHGGINISTRERSPDLIVELREAGVIQRNAQVLANAVGTIVAAGLPLLVSGPRASQVAAALGRGLAMTHAVIADVPVGLIDASQMHQLLGIGCAEESLVVRHYNLSALEAYGLPLVDVVIPAIVKRQPSRAAIILSAARGVAALPLEDDLAAVAVEIDTATDLAAIDADKAVLIGQLREDRSTSRIRSGSLARILEDSAERSEAQDHALCAVIAEMLNAAPNPL